MDALRLHDFATRYTAAWCSPHPERVAAFFSPAGSLTVNNGTPAVGRREIIELARSFMTTFPDLKVLMNDLCIHENSAEYHWTLIGTHRGPEGLGHRVQISGFERWHMAADGLIAASEGHFDGAEYQRQLEQSCLKCPPAHLQVCRL